MGGRSFKELQDELSRLMGEQIESLKKETFVSLSREEVRQQEERLQRIREVSADFLAALKRNEPQRRDKTQEPVDEMILQLGR